MTQVTYTDESGNLRCSGCSLPWEPAHICPVDTPSDHAELATVSLSIYSPSTDERVATALERIAAALEKLADEYASEAQE